ncbi:MAG: TonB-dependent receptor plug domain-containing protein, partial [Gemmatimonadaceae bacterium]
MTVSGYVSAAGKPLANARVRIVELGLERSSDAAGRYSFVVPSADVRGQTVQLVVTMADRRARYAPSTVQIVLAGRPVAQDFALVLASGETTLIAAAPGAPATGMQAPGGRRDTLDVRGASGPPDVSSLLVGRFAGLSVSTPSVFGGSSSIVYRGPRSILGANQPLFVVDGAPVLNTTFASTAERYGAGGFDYGSPLSDLDPSTVGSIRVLSPVEASALYGGLGANGVVAISTKNGSDGSRLGIAADYQSSNGPYLRLPALQNQYGQGLDGTFQFFDGRGGGVNDDVDQNWGPALDGRPLAQASYTEAARPDVRLWNPQPDNVKGYFSAARNSTLTAAVQGNDDIGSFRASVGSYTTRGITPRDRGSRQDAAFAAAMHPLPRLDLALDLSGSQNKRENAPGTGDAEGNPVFQFLRMGRQVDTDSLRAHLRDGSGKQVSWSYTGHNNPYFLALADSNYSRRYHVTTGGRATVALAPWLSATLRGGFDYYRDGRLFTIASGWMGGFPFYTGTGDFSKGGSEGDEIAGQHNSLSARLDGSRTVAGGARWTFGVGA